VEQQPAGADLHGEDRAHPYLTTRGPDVTNPAVQPAVVNVVAQPLLTATINDAWDSNYYFQKIGGAEYYVDTPPWAGGAPLPLNPSDGAFDTPTENVQATIDTRGLSAGRHIIFVRGKGTETYDGNRSFGPVSAVFLQVVQAGGTPVASATPVPQATPAAARTPLPPTVALPDSSSRTFPETGKSVGGIFLDYWNNHGGLAQQGYPISDVIGEVSDLDGKPYTVQYLERAVFERHPENAGTPYEVLLSQLGTFSYKARYLPPALWMP